MVAELNELKWLLLPLYPFIVILLFGAWLTMRVSRTRKVDVDVSILGLRIAIKIDDSQGVQQ